MSLVSEMFGNFDFSCLDDPEFKEDSVREEIIAPMLRRIGWKPTGPYQIVRSKPLQHPYVMFGSQKRKLSIIPDYMLIVDGNPCFVLDAKNPNEEITKGDNVAQAYSYAIHPDVRVWNYGLCNGRSLSLFEIASIIPKRVYDLTNLTDATILDINQKLNPRSVNYKEIFKFAPDGGTYLRVVMNLPTDIELVFPDVIIPYVGTIGDGHFTISVDNTSMAEMQLAFSFDFNKEQLKELLSQLPSEVADKIEKSLISYPYYYKNKINPPKTNIHCKQSKLPVFSAHGEMFFPLLVTKFSVVNNR